MQVHGGGFNPAACRVFAGPRFDPFKGFVELAEGEGLVGRAHHAGVLEEAFHLESAGQSLGDVAEHQIAVVFFELVLDLLQYVRRGDVQRLHAAHAEDHVLVVFGFRFQRCVKLARGAEEKAALQLEHD